MFQLRPTVIARWSEWELDLLDSFLEQEPAPVDRVEIAIARFMTMYKTVHQPQGAKTPKLVDFLPYLNAWPTQQSGGRYSDLDREFLNELL